MDYKRFVSENFDPKLQGIPKAILNAYIEEQCQKKINFFQQEKVLKFLEKKQKYPSKVFASLFSDFLKNLYSEIDFYRQSLTTHHSNCTICKEPDWKRPLSFDDAASYRHYWDSQNGTCVHKDRIRHRYNH